MVGRQVEISQRLGVTMRTWRGMKAAGGFAVLLAIGGLVGRTATAQTLDHFMFYGAGATRTCSGGATPGAVCTRSSACGGGQCVAAPPLAPFGPVQLTDGLFGAFDYKVTAVKRLAPPANKNGEGITDPITHLREYNVSIFNQCVGGPHPGSGCHSSTDCGTGGVCRTPKASRTIVRVVNQCNNLLLRVDWPAKQLLLPANKSLTAPVPPPDNTQLVDHFLCYNAQTVTRLPDGTSFPAFPKGIQVVVADQFETLRYDVQKITRLCDPVAKQEDALYAPIVLSGPTKNTPRPIASASVHNPSAHLVCYRVARAGRFIPQTGCGATNPADHGTLIVPRQVVAPLPRGVFVDDQFGADRINPVVPNELCIPSSESICGNNVAESPEACDGTDNAACGGLPCRADCTCEPPTCGNNIRETSEACDGSDNAACGGLPCLTDCSCTPPTCGDNIQNRPIEDCDGPDAAACPGQCQPGCVCPTPPCVADATRTTYAGRSPACGDLTDHASCLSGYEMGDGARALACEDGYGSCTGCDRFGQGNNLCTNTCLCGNNALDPGEECDGGASSACPGQCQSDCRCPPPACTEAPSRAFVGWVPSTNTTCSSLDNDPTGCNAAYFVNGYHLATSCFYSASDQKCYGCEGTYVDAGECTNVCLCGDNVVEGLEDCDGSDNSFCHGGQCGSDCRCQ